jgi:hypothetical protein
VIESAAFVINSSGHVVDVVEIQGSGTPADAASNRARTDTLAVS